MKTITLAKYGSADGLRLNDIPIPVPKSDEVLIKVNATAVTELDVHIRQMNESWIHKLSAQMTLGFGRARKPVLGMVVSGTVMSTGGEASKFEIGDAVFGICSGSASDKHIGSYAEYLAQPESCGLTLKPENLSFEEAAAMPYGGILAIHLINKAPIEDGDRVVVYGADRSVGTMLVQLAKNAGAHVTSVCSGDQSALMYKLGSDQVIDSKLMSAELMIESYKYFFDTERSGATSPLKVKFMHAISSKGKYISIEKVRQRELQKSLQTLRRWAEIGIVKPVLDRIYPLHEIAEAHRYSESGAAVGSVVIRVC